MHAFFTLAAVAPNRQRNFRAIVIAHVLMLGVLLVGASWQRTALGSVWFGHILLVAGIIEGALLIGWRLTQLPKSQALDFLLVSATRPSQVLLAEALVGLTRLGFTTLAGPSFCPQAAFISAGLRPRTLHGCSDPYRPAPSRYGSPAARCLGAKRICACGYNQNH
jgi:hypothetical protein